MSYMPWAVRKQMSLVALRNFLTMNGESFGSTFDEVRYLRSERNNAILLRNGAKIAYCGGNWYIIHGYTTEDKKTMIW